MKQVIQQRTTVRARPNASLGAMLALALALALFGASSEKSFAQSSQVRNAFSDSQSRTAVEPQPRTIRLASGQKSTPTAKTTKAPVRKAQPAPLPPPVDSKTPLSAEDLPAMPLKAVLPLAGAVSGNGLKLTDNKNGTIDLLVRDKPLSQVLAYIAQTQKLNIVSSNDIDAVISITLTNVPLEEALTDILAVAKYTWVRRNNIILITSLEDSVNLPADIQGRQIQVFDLDFASATVVSTAIQNFLSPVGKVSVTSSDKANNRLTQERVIVEDTPESLARIGAYIAQIDHPPRQVLIEAHVLQVNLDDTTKCGINLNQLVRISHANLNLKTTGLANADADQAFLATLDGGDVGGVVEAIQTTTDAKVLGSPKLLVLNEQEARLQVGQHLGFKVSTTTETSTTQNVQFLDVGVVLRIIPRITRNGCVLLHVRPEVSKGDVNPETGLPESDTAELETDVMLSDGQGMVIGGLIKENDNVTQSKVPYLGNVRGIGWLFRRTEITKERAEIIVAIVPRIQPYDPQWQAYEQGELVKAGVQLFHGPLCRNDRPWDPILPDGKRIKYPLIPHPNGRPRNGNVQELGPEYAVPPHPLPEQHFYGDNEGCEPVEPDADGPTMNAPLPSAPVPAEGELPLPQLQSRHEARHLINDQAVTRTSGTSP